MINACVQYNHEDFTEQMQKVSKNDHQINDKLEKFLARVSQHVEEALQSNELINVFQDDFEILGDEDANTDTKAATTNMQARNF